MFVQAGNSSKLYVNEEGRVKDSNFVNVPPKFDAEGYKYVEVGRTKYYVHELVLQNHGKPPHKNRLPKSDEVASFIDGDTTNTHVDNLEYTKKSNKKANFRDSEGVPEAVEEFVWQLLKQGVTHEKIQRRVAESSFTSRSISIGKIADIRKKYSEKVGADELTPSERQSLDSIKRELGEVDDAKAKVQGLAKAKAEEKSEKIQAEKEEEAKEAKKEKEEILADTTYKANEKGGGWWNIIHKGEEVFPKSFREKEAKSIAKTLNKGGEEAEALLEELK